MKTIKDFFKNLLEHIFCSHDYQVFSERVSYRLRSKDGEIVRVYFCSKCLKTKRVYF